MPDINLLPEELRDDEPTKRKKDRKYNFKLTSPADEPVLAKPKKQPWWKRLKRNQKEKKEKSYVVPGPKVPPVNFSAGKEIVEQKKATSEIEKKPISAILQQIKAHEAEQAVVKKTKQVDESEKKPRPYESEHKSAAMEKPEVHSGTLDIDLIPEDFQKEKDVQVRKRFAIVIGSGLTALVLVFVGYIGLLWKDLQNASEVKSASAEIESLDRQIAALEEEKKAAQDMQTRLAAAKKVFDGHVYWTLFFQKLEENTIPEVRFNNFSMTGREQLVILATGASYEAVAKQLLAFEQAEGFVKNVRVDSAVARIDPETGGIGGVDFNIHLEFYPDVFLKQQ